MRMNKTFGAPAGASASVIVPGFESLYVRPIFASPNGSPAWAARLAQTPWKRAERREPVVSWRLLAREALLQLFHRLIDRERRGALAGRKCLAGLDVHFSSTAT